jgi:hypothetical protein
LSFPRGLRYEGYTFFKWIPEVVDAVFGRAKTLNKLLTMRRRRMIEANKLFFIIVRCPGLGSGLTQLFAVEQGMINAILSALEKLPIPAEPPPSPNQ